MTNASDQIYSLSSWSADWATADAKKFQVTETAEAAATDVVEEPEE
jgi:hypothetical protein